MNRQKRNKIEGQQYRNECVKFCYRNNIERLANKQKHNRTGQDTAYQYNNIYFNQLLFGQIFEVSSL